jgi:hypothetical protein
MLPVMRVAEPSRQGVLRRPRCCCFVINNDKRQLPFIVGETTLNNDFFPFLSGKGKIYVIGMTLVFVLPLRDSAWSTMQAEKKTSVSPPPFMLEFDPW